MIVQTSETPNVVSGQTFNYNTSCWTYVGYFTNPYTTPSGYIRTNYNGNYFGTPSTGSIFNTCEDCVSTPISQTPSPTPSLTPSNTPSITTTPSNTPSITTTPSLTPTPSTSPPQEVIVDFDVTYDSGSTIATYIFTASEVLNSDLRINFDNILYDEVNKSDVKIESFVDILRGEISGSTTRTVSEDYNRIEPYNVSYENIVTSGSSVNVSTINKYSSVIFLNKNKPLTVYYRFVDCCEIGYYKNLIVDANSSWVTNGYGVIIDGVCYKPKKFGGDGSDGEFYGPDFKNCKEERRCESCPSVTPSVTPSITPTISITPSLTITPSSEYYLSCDSYMASSTPSVTPSEGITASVTPSPTTTPTVTPTLTVTPTSTVTPTNTTTPSTTMTPSITPTPTTSQVITETFEVRNDGNSSYNIDGDLNPTISLVRRLTYVFNINASGHPFYIKTATGTGTGNQYNDGVTNNGTDSGTIIFTVPSDAPSQLYYQCSVHSSMNGRFAITDNPVGGSSPSSTPTPTITPSTTTGDKTIYVYYPNL
jgi:hypothetical protein